MPTEKKTDRAPRGDDHLDRADWRMIKRWHGNPKKIGPIVGPAYGTDLKTVGRALWGTLFRKGRVSHPNPSPEEQVALGMAWVTMSKQNPGPVGKLQLDALLREYRYITDGPESIAAKINRAQRRRAYYARDKSAALARRETEWGDELREQLRGQKATGTSIPGTGLTKKGPGDLSDPYSDPRDWFETGEMAPVASSASPIEDEVIAKLVLDDWLSQLSPADQDALRRIIMREPIEGEGDKKRRLRLRAKLRAMIED
jgi:hypothetical protein